MYFYIILWVFAEVYYLTYNIFVYINRWWKVVRDPFVPINPFLRGTPIDGRRRAVGHYNVWRTAYRPQPIYMPRYYVR